MNFIYKFNSHVLYLIVLISVSYLIFINEGNYAYEWPSIDMVPFFERYFDVTSLSEDFYTNAISEAPNPRWIFGYFVILLSKLFGVHYFSVFILHESILCYFYSKFNILLFSKNNNILDKWIKS